MITLPYKLQEGQKAYAAKVMANLNAIIGNLNNVEIDGMSTADLQAVLQILFDSLSKAIVASQIGNAKKVRFADGDTMQEKLDSGELDGKDGVSLQLNGMYRFFVDGGYLKMYAPSDVERPPFRINDDGELEYIIPDPETEETEVAVYNLGRVEGEKGDTGDMSASVYDPTGKKEDVFAYVDSKPYGESISRSCFVYAAAWESNQAVVDLEEIGENTNFYVGTSYSAGGEEEQAWRDAQPKVIAQEEGSFTLKSYGSTPEVDIPLTVVILP